MKKISDPRILTRLIGLGPSEPKSGAVAREPTPLPAIEPMWHIANITGTCEASEREPRCLLITDPILCDETKDYTVHDVVFTIKSHDQGWTAEDGYDGVYENSYTWFEVAILRPVKAGVETSVGDKHSLNSESCIKKYLNDREISSQLNFVINTKNDSPFWHLQRNRRGDGDPMMHMISWARECKDSESERLGWDYDLKTGRGSGVGFVPSLKKGDRVAIIARAKKSVSVNHILKASIQIHFEGFEPSNKDTQHRPHLRGHRFNPYNKSPGKRH